MGEWFPGLLKSINNPDIRSSFLSIISDNSFNNTSIFSANRFVNEKAVLLDMAFNNCSIFPLECRIHQLFPQHMVNMPVFRNTEKAGSIKVKTCDDMDGRWNLFPH